MKSVAAIAAECRAEAQTQAMKWLNENAAEKLKRMVIKTYRKRKKKAFLDFVIAKGDGYGLLHSSRGMVILVELVQSYGYLVNGDFNTDTREISLNVGVDLTDFYDT